MRHDFRLRQASGVGCGMIFHGISWAGLNAQLIAQVEIDLYLPDRL